VDRIVLKSLKSALTQLCAIPSAFAPGAARGHQALPGRPLRARHTDDLFGLLGMCVYEVQTLQRAPDAAGGSSECFGQEGLAEDASDWFGSSANVPQVPHVHQSRVRGLKS
jgi:hypothetical protein